MKNAVAGVGLLALFALMAGCSKAQGSASAPTVELSANERGFSPPSVTIPKGQAATLLVTRTTDKTCAREVVFPDLGITRDLPLGAPVAIELPAGVAKTYRFQCGMGMFKGSVVVQ